MQNKGPEEHTILTLQGRLTLGRRRYAAPGLGRQFPLAPWIDRIEDTVSLGLRELACRLNLAARNFDKAAENRARAAPVRLSGELLRQLVESEGQAIQKAAQTGRLPVDGDASDCPALDADGQPTEPTRLYLGSDGVMVPVITPKEKEQRRANSKAKRRRRGRKGKPLPRARKGTDGPFKEFKIVTLYDDQAEHRLVSVTPGDGPGAGPIRRRDGGRVGLDKADDKVGMGDGSEWIKNPIQRHSIPLDALGLDFSHLAANVHRARRAVYGEEDADAPQPLGNAGAARVLHPAQHEGYAAFPAQRQDGQRGLSRGQKAAQQLLNYGTEREEMILYPPFQAVGRQIGSGPTESMCKATTQRLKGCGKRWDTDQVEAILALEALDQSGGWQAYWDAFLAQPP